MRKSVLFLTLTAISLAQATDSGQSAEFEVASIRPAKQDGANDSRSDPGVFLTHNLTLKRLIGMAYQVDLRQILGGPNWVDSDSYDIRAKIPSKFAAQRRDKIPLMVQSLLADRFHLAIHRRPMQIAGYAMVVAKKGAKLERSTAGAANSHTRERNGHLTAENVTMDGFAKNLSRNPQVGRLVVDRTGLAGPYNFELEWDTTNPLAVEADGDSGDRPSIFRALEDRLGLRLEPAQVQVEAIVIDHAERPSEN